MAREILLFYDKAACSVFSSTDGNSLVVFYLRANKKVFSAWDDRAEATRFCMNIHTVFVVL